MEISGVNIDSAYFAGPEEHASPTPLRDEQRAIVHAVKAINASELLGPKNELTLILDRASRRTVVRVLDKRTREVIRQIPEEQVLQMAEELK